MSEKLFDVNKESVTPEKYFEVLKTGLTKQKKLELDKQLSTIASQIIKAKKVGQHNLLQKLSFTYDIIVKEQIALTAGFSDFVYKDNVKQLIDEVEPKDSIKIIELENYSRVIPENCLDLISKAKDLDIFDDFIVVYTDLTNEEQHTQAQKDFIDNNRDPIVFGYFNHEQTGMVHDRFYLIADWVDEYCELTFNSMIEKMSALDIEDGHKISTDDSYVRRLVQDTLDDMKDGKKIEITSHNKKTFWKRLWSRGK